MRILVTGGSGVLGSQVVERLRATREEPIVLSRRAAAQPGWVQGDISSGVGLAEALAGADVVVHAASAAAEFSKIKQTDIEGTRNLVAAAETAGVRHLVYISIVGIDKIDYGYYRAKLAAEETIKAGGLPWTIQRATQFHELVDRVLRAGRGPFLFIPSRMSVQPVDSALVAERLAQIATAPPAGMLEDIGGPEVLTADELAQSWLARRSLRKRIVHFAIPGKAARGFRAGYHLSPDHSEGGLTWSEWLGRAYAGGRVPTAYTRVKPGPEA